MHCIYQSVFQLIKMCILLTVKYDLKMRILSILIYNVNESRKRLQAFFLKINFDLVDVKLAD